MRILVVIDSLGFGGAERLIVSLLPELKLKGIECDVAVLEAPYSLKEELVTAGFRVYELDIKHRWMVPDALITLHELIKTGRYDAIWGHLYFGNLYAMLSGVLAGIKIRVMTIHSRGYIKNPPVRLWDHFRFNLEKFVGNSLATRIVAVSHATANDYIASFGWKNVQVVYNAIPINRLPPPIDSAERSAIRLLHGIGTSDLLLVTAARYVADKGHSVMIEALAGFRNQHGWCPRWISAGNGPLKEKLKQQAAAFKLTDNVLLLDVLPQKELFKLIQSADVFVLPSLSEPFGIAAGEALAMGVPCILSKVDGLCELAGKGESAVAKMVPPGDSAKLSDAIWEVYTDTENKEEKGRDGMQHIYENFDTPIIVEKWCEIFNSQVVR